MIFSIVLYKKMASLTTDEEMLLAILDSDSDSNVVKFILVSALRKQTEKKQ